MCCSSSPHVLAPRAADQTLALTLEQTQEGAIALVDDYLTRDIPVGAIIIDSPGETSYNSFVFEPSQ
ncbi:MAG: hypothetical protein AMJ63_17840 [Myxococcales bacterium SG8_38_1]|nr:MAG: hypothetical protein AMJ63_17840 [Myxococcales bacterium SG8_38_1]